MATDSMLSAALSGPWVFSVGALLAVPQYFYGSNMSDSDDEVPTLSAHTLTALQEFYAENLALQSSSKGSEEQFNLGSIEEDWGLSQFWYSEDTAQRLAEELVCAAGKEGRIACVSAPSVYQKLKQGVVPGSECITVVILEYDRRFATYGDEFIFYDYNQPLALPPHIQQHSFDVVLADPPYLSQECLSKVAQTVHFLSKSKVLLCTGAVMQSVAKELLDVDMCGFLPQHHRNLSNDFRCYTNYPSALK